MKTRGEDFIRGPYIIDNPETAKILKHELDNTTCPLTKREYFAALALQNIQNVFMRRSNAEICKAVAENYGLNKSGDSKKLFARMAVEQADALIEELNK